MNKNEIIFAILKTCLLWYVVMLLFFVPLGQDWFLVAIKDIWMGVQSLFVGGLAGALIAVIVHFTRTSEVLHSLAGSCDNKIMFSIGKIPAFRSWSRDRSAGCPPEFSGFLREYEKTYPDHASLFMAGIKILAAHRHIPASVVPGGHGGASLEKHSFNVLREALEAMQTWVYKGQFTSSGYQTATVQDKAYRFYPDPLIPLCALLHDIGKIECYQIVNGEPTEVKGRHDEEGSKMLSALPEFRALSNADRSAMTIAVGYYHHPGSIPLHQPDRPRALAVFTLEMDIRAGKKEGGYIGAGARLDEDEPGVTVTPGSASGSTLPAQEIGPEQDEITASSAVTEILAGVLPEDQREQFTANRHYPVDVCTDALAVFIREYVKKPNFFGLKNGGVCFCQDLKMREHLNSINKTKSFNDLHVHQDDKTTRLTSFTLKVLWALHDRGMLVSSIKNADGPDQKFSPNIAVFDISGTGLDGSVRVTKFCLVFSSDVSPLLNDIEDCPNPFEIVKNSLGDQYRQDKGKKNELIKNEKTKLKRNKNKNEGIDIAEFDLSVILDSTAQEPDNKFVEKNNEKPKKLTDVTHLIDNLLQTTEGDQFAQSKNIEMFPIQSVQNKEESREQSQRSSKAPKPVQQNDW
ncbi:HD domain-containing protein [Ferrovum myxofaciens]|uniref:HD domain-containing protein n=1 Tax=Ferrovum myxofaciens TaxID=416213 RepID=A0A9E6MWJ7_9PROT|nr:HD domain-containing protein [Ferrovum myxofaciens]QKE37324.1 MAG: HD domain-containing protein [Ferrovum myxofaciens]QWY74970.1 MAG: HD domain-containing protein [Ferrovum myxofaciens]QWY77717.1 MAG: HD domain-containing protein [Ferrovum myxofaciens]